MRRFPIAFAMASIATANVGWANATDRASAALPPTHSADARFAQLIPQTSPAEATTGNPSLAPLKWVGMLVIPTPTLGNPNSIVECTAQFIRPNVLLTAGHCLKDLPANPAGPWPDVTKGTF